MAFQRFLDSFSMIGIFLGFIIAALLLLECGYRLGRWWQARTHEPQEGPTPMIVGSLLALMAFLLAVTMGMASDRFDGRRALVLKEANALGTTYLRAGYLPAPAAGEIQALLREYVPLRIATEDMVDNERKIARSIEVQSQLWSIAENLARAMPESDVLGLFIQSLNESIDLHETRIMSSIYGRVPETVLFLLLFGSTLTLTMVGYSAGLSNRRSPFTAVVLTTVLGAVITLVFDLDRPQDGFLKVSQKPLVDLDQSIRNPLSRQ